MNYKILFASLVVVVIIGVFTLFGGKSILNDDYKLSIYESDRLGIGFSYPANYFIVEKDLSNAYRKHFALILTDDTEENRLVREGLSPGREGPVTISFDFYQNPEDYSALEWVLGHNASNYKLGDGVYEEMVLSGKPAVSYSWDGLYRADNVVVVHEDYIISIVVTYITPDDQIRHDFTEILDTVSFN